jgi:hypothetical protein
MVHVVASHDLYTVCLLVLVINPKQGVNTCTVLIVFSTPFWVFCSGSALHTERVRGQDTYGN